MQKNPNRRLEAGLQTHSLSKDARAHQCYKIHNAKQQGTVLK